MDIFLQGTARRIGDDDVLAKVDALLDWSAFAAILKRGLKRSGFGPQGYDPLVLFRCLLVAQWHGLSDPKLERALKVRLDFMLFCGLDLHGTVPDETTHCRFRGALVKAGVYDDLLAEVCRQIEGHGLKLKEAEAAIIDATLIEAAARRGHMSMLCRRTERKAMCPTIRTCITAPIRTRDRSKRAVKARWATRVLPAPMRKGSSTRGMSPPPM